MRTISVAHIAATTLGGAGIATARIEKAIRLNCRGIKNVLYVGKGSPSGSEGELLPINRSSLLTRVLSRIARPTPYERWMRSIDAMVRERSRYELFSPPFEIQGYDFTIARSRKDVLHLHWVCGLFSYQRFFYENKLPVVWTLHDQNPCLGGFHYDLDRDAVPELLALEEQACHIKRASLAGMQITAVGNSQWMSRKAERSNIFPPDCRFETVYYPLDSSEFRPQSKDACKEILGISKEQLVIGFASESLGNARKGFHDLVMAIQRLPRCLKQSVVLLSFGASPSTAGRAIVDNKWIHLGYLESPAVQSVAYSAMDVFVIPSRAEAFGQTAIEALACETPVLGTAVGGIPETVIDGVTGWTAKPSEPDDLSAKLSCLLKDPNRRQQFGKTGRELVIERHCPVKIARQYERIYREAVA